MSHYLSLKSYLEETTPSLARLRFQRFLGTWFPFSLFFNAPRKELFPLRKALDNVNSEFDYLDTYFKQGKKIPNRG